MRKTNFRKIAVLVSLVLSLLAFVVVPAFADEVPTTGVSDGAVSSVDIADEHVCGDEGRCPYCERNLAPDLNDYDDAMDYLDGYTTNKAEDENFAENVETAMNSVRKTTPLFGKFWALIPPIIAIALALVYFALILLMRSETSKRLSVATSEGLVELMQEQSMNLLKNTVFPVLVFDKIGTILWANSVAFSLFTLEDSPIGKNISSLIQL